MTCLNMLRFLRCYYLHFTRHSELLRASLAFYLNHSGAHDN